MAFDQAILVLHLYCEALYEIKPPIKASSVLKPDGSHWNRFRYRTFEVLQCHGKCSNSSHYMYPWLAPINAIKLQHNYQISRWYVYYFNLQCIQSIHLLSACMFLFFERLLWILYCPKVNVLHVVLIMFCLGINV